MATKPMDLSPYDIRNAQCVSSTSASNAQKMILKVESIEVCLDCGNLSVVVEA